MVVVGCPNSWVSDKVCDVRCNNEACAWDAGDCGIQLLYQRVPGLFLNDKSRLISFSSLPHLIHIGARGLVSFFTLVCVVSVVL